MFIEKLKIVNLVDNNWKGFIYYYFKHIITKSLLNVVS